jgi:hypothetical protein
MVVVWDTGPSKPAMPVRPKRPKGEEGDPEFDLAMIDYREAIEEYERGLKAYKQAKAEYDDFQTRYGGPYELTWWSVDAQKNLGHDREAVKDGRQATLRYYISSKTRGYERTPNLGLPKGMRPGPGQATQEERARAGAADLDAQKRADPVFGTQELRP